MSVAFVDVGSNNASTSGTTIAASAINAATGNLIVVLISGFAAAGGANAVVTSVADTAGNTYTRAGTEINGLSVDQRLTCFYAKNVTANASNVVTATFTGTVTFRGIVAIQYSGADVSSPYDTQSARTYESSTTTTHTTAAATNAVADAVAVAFFVVYDTAYAVSATAPNNLRAASANIYIGADVIASATGSQTVTVTTATANKSTNCLWIFSGASSKTPVPVFMNQYRQRTA